MWIGSWYRNMQSYDQHHVIYYFLDRTVERTQNPFSFCQASRQNSEMEFAMDVRSLSVDRLLCLYSEQNAGDVDTIKFWEEQIHQYCLQNKTLTFTVNALIHAFTIDDMYPSSLEPALNVLLTKMKRVTECTSEAANELDLLQSLLASITLWASAGRSNSEVRYLSVKLVEDIENALRTLVSKLGEHRSCVFVKANPHLPAEMTFSGILRQASTVLPAESLLAVLLNTISDTDADLILQHMVKSGKASLSSDGSIVKIHSTKGSQQAVTSSVFSFWSASSATAPRSVAVSEADEASLRLRSSIYQIEHKVEALRADAEAALLKAKLCKVSY